MDDDRRIISDRGRKENSTNAPPTFSQAMSPADETEVEDLASSLENKLKMLFGDSRYGTVCIYRVPEKHRNKNPEAYTPRLVSIGFIHYGGSQLQGMEQYKLKYLHNFLATFGVSMKDLAKYVQSQETLVCGCYEDIYITNTKLNSKQSNPKVVKPSEVILLDAIFVIELFLKNHFLEMREKGDIIFDNPWVSNDILHDLLLFENQLPWWFLYKLYDAFVSYKVRKCLNDDTVYPPSFYELAHKYFKNVGNTGKLLLTRDFRGARHLVELLAILHLPDERVLYERIQTASVRRQLVGKKSDFARCPTATKLKAAGVKFRHGAGRKCLLDVTFEEDSGVLTIPPLTVNDCSETFFRNLIAFEQSGYHNKCITSYVILLDNLIDTNKDVDLLIHHKIISNQLGSSDEVAQLFNNLYKEFVTDPKQFYFVEECSKLTDYSRDRLHKWNAKLTEWWAMLWRDYFGTPWTFTSFVAAFLLLALTVLQSVCTVIQTWFKK